MKIDYRQELVMLTAHALQGLLAQESENCNYNPSYVDPDTGGLTWIAASYPKDGNGNQDFTKPVRQHKVLQSREEIIAQEAVNLALAAQRILQRAEHL